MDIESSQEISLDNWGKQLLENILLTAAEAVGEPRQISDSIEVTLMPSPGHICHLALLH